MTPAPTILNRLLLLVAVLALPFVGLAGYGLARQFRSDREHALHDVSLIQQTADRQIRGWLDGTRLRLERLAHSDVVQRRRLQRIDTVFQEFYENQPELSNLALLDEGGHVLAAVNIRPTDPSVSLLDDPHCGEAARATAFYISPPFVGATSKTWTCVMSQPVMSAEGTRLGALLVALNLPQLASSLTLPTELRGFSVGAVDNQGTVLLRLPEPARFIGQSLPDFTHLRNALDAGQRQGIQCAGIDGSKRTVSASPLLGTPWVVFASVSTADILSDAWLNFWRTFAVIAALLIFATWLAAIYARAIAQPITALANAARAQTEGRTDARALIAGPAEIAGTAAAFNAMVDARERDAAALRESEERFRSVANSAPAFIWMCNAAGETTFRNDAWLAFTRHTASGLAPTNWHSHIHPDDKERCQAEFTRHIGARSDYTMEFRLRDADGHYRVILDHGKPLHGHDGAFTGFIGVSFDITDLRRVEQERQSLDQKILEMQKLESLGVLAGGIAHDFNNLLTGILGNASLARHELPTGVAGDQLAQIEQAARRAAELCRQMLAYAGKGRFVVQQLDLNALLTDMRSLLQLSIGKKVNLRLRLGDALPAVHADATQLRQLLVNFVVNASEAIGDRTGSISLATGLMRAGREYLSQSRFANDLPEGEYVYLEITDDGCGMNRETLARIFDPFFTTKFTGRGLGLAAAIGIVRGHSGAIKVYSEPGRGTTFKVLLPAVGGPAEQVRSVQIAARPWQGSGNILLIDDEEIVRRTSSRILESFGFVVELAADGHEGVALFTRNPARYDVVLLDLTMPGMDGEEVFRQLRLIRPDVRVVLMSGFNKQEAVNRFLGKGLAGFIQKPFEISTLTTELRSALGEHPPVV